MWFVATAVAAVIFCIKKCANTDCEFIVNRRKVGLISYVRNFLANTKNNNEYIHGTEKLIITSHKLKYYKNYITELTNSLNTLNNEKAQFYVNSEEKTIE